MTGRRKATASWRAQSTANIGIATKWRTVCIEMPICRDRVRRVWGARSTQKVGRIIDLSIILKAMLGSYKRISSKEMCHLLARSTKKRRKKSRWQNRLRNHHTNRHRSLRRKSQKKSRNSHQPRNKNPKNATPTSATNYTLARWWNPRCSRTNAKNARNNNSFSKAKSSPSNPR